MGSNTMGSDPMVKKPLSHYAPRPMQQPQMPNMKQVKRSVCNYIRHFSPLSFPLRQFCRATANQLSSFLSQFYTLYTAN